MIKKKDIILIFVLLIIAGVGLLVVNLMQKDDGASVTITVMGKTYGTYALDENQIINIEDGLGTNTVIIKDDYVYMEEANCPDQYCVQHAKIHYNHETIICLPHELVVEINGGETSDIDIKTQ